MKRPDFDRLIDRHGTSCTKYDAIRDLIGDRTDILPMWIADMDFETPDFIIEAIQKRLTHRVLGYTIPCDKYCGVLQDWFERHYGFRPDAKHLCYTPGIVSGIYKVIQCLTHEGDGIALCPPVYHPFAQVINGSRRKVVEAPLLLENNRYEIDFNALDKALAQARILIWCHPHNPGGRVWSVEELQKVAEVAHKHNVTIISDEIHADLTFKAYKHHPFPSVSDTARACSLSFMAPSKAFNMPGVIASQLYIPNDKLRETVFGYLEANHLDAASATTYDAVMAAYSQGDEWLASVIAYIEDNVAYVQQYLNENLPQLSMLKPEASFLIFLDCRKLGFPNGAELTKFLIDKAGLLLNDGTMFGTGGEGFMRLNVGVPRSVLKEAMERLHRAVQTLQ